MYDDEGWQETGHIVYSKWATDLLRYIREKAPTRILGLTHMPSSYFDQLFAYLLRTSAFMLIGSSGLLKTATVREVFNVFTVKNDRLTSVRSTEASLHVMTEKAYDDTLVIDDFNREGSRQEIA